MLFIRVTKLVFHFSLDNEVIDIIVEMFTKLA